MAKSIEFFVCICYNGVNAYICATTQICLKGIDCIMAKLIELVGISKSYDGETVIDNMNLYIRDKEI